MKFVNTLRCALLVALLQAGAGRAELPIYHAGDPDAPPVTTETLSESDRFWPYRVELTRPFARPDGDRTPRPGQTGVLIRAEERTVRIDFGRMGRHEVPIASTDVVDRANRIREGRDGKTAPNLVLAIGPRLVDPAQQAVEHLPVERVAAEAKGFLTVFADPDAESFAELARTLAPLDGRHGVMTVLLPQGDHPDARMLAQLRSLGWKVPFVFDRFAEPYTRSLLGETPPASPVLMLQTLDGRVLRSEPWSPEVVPGMAAALDAGFGGGKAAAGPPPAPQAGDSSS